MKIFDCFMYFDEDLVLELRLNYLSKLVDHFIIVESKFTHKGDQRELKFDINKFKRFKNKILYIPVTDMPDGDNPYLRENFQRDMITKGISKANLDDFIIVGDIDEIPDLKNLNFMFLVFLQI